MKGFFKILFGSCLGTLLALFLLILIVGGIIGSAASQFEKKTESIGANSVLKLKLSNFIPERTNNVETNYFDIENFDSKTYGLFDYLEAIEEAKNDKHIKGIVVDQYIQSMGMVKAKLIRDALEDFKTSGKFVYAYSDSYGMSSYYLSSVADKIIMHPLGGLDLRGYGYISEYYTNLLEKLGVDAEIYYAGKFKSATEPLRRTNMSEENRTQIRTFLNNYYESFLDAVSSSRPISKEDLKTAINEFSSHKLETAAEIGLIDQIGYSDELIDIIKSDLDLEADDKINYVNFQEYMNQHKSDVDFSVKEKVAVLYAEGVIGGKEDENGRITEDRYIKAIRDIRKNDKIKAIVLRVNSGGGSALLSDKIWRELALCRADGKPVVTSMGNYAASGGYYIACASDKILAEENTLTGSIGVFAVFLNTKDFWNDKLHIEFDTLNLSKYATDFTAIDDRSPGEKKIIQESVDHIYQTFLKRVADNRGMTIEQVNEIAQGRVWTGPQALEVGLVDEIAGLDKAIETAAELAELDNYRVSEFPKIKDPFEKIIEDLTGSSFPKSSMTKELKHEIKSQIPLASKVIELQEMQEPQARMYFNLDW